jgi:phospholipid/cholesterol/gamma-HCH transport system substrate-binding protein
VRDDEGGGEVIKKALRPGEIFAITMFVLTCFAVLLFLWITFGGSSPLKPQGYRVSARFPEATLLASQADVRISGVPVGKVVAMARSGNETRVTMEIASRYAPIPRDTRAMLRLKTLFGETYVELTPGTKGSGRLPDGGSLPDGAISHSVEVDEILRTFDKPTRAAFRTWLQSQGAAVEARGADINAGFASLPAFVESADHLLATLDSQAAAVRRLVASTGDFFSAISEREGELRGLITDSDRLFKTTAARNGQLADIFRALPRFEREATATLPPLTAFARHARPIVKRLQPAADQLAPVSEDVERLSPELEGFFERIDQVATAAKPGLPAFNRLLERFPALLDAFQPFLRNANPVVRYIGAHKREVTAFFANTAAAAEAHDAAHSDLHYLRTSQTLGPEALSFYPRTLGSTRLNPYFAPGTFDQLSSGLPVLDRTHCESGDVAPPPLVEGTLSELAILYGFRSGSRDIARPPCRPQGAFPGFGTQYPQVRAEP